MLRLIEKHTDTLIEQTENRPQETLEFELNEQLDTFPFNPPKNLIKNGKGLLAVTSFEETKSVFSVTDENSKYAITILGHWNSKSAGKTIDELNKILELKSQNDI